MPIPVFTLYNCGTNFHRHSGDTVARLYALTIPNQAFITDGVGSGTFKPHFMGGRANPGNASKPGGLIFGVGMDANVQAAVDAVRAAQPGKINMCGWSRGGVTCTKISRQLSREPGLNHIPINIFAIDPVPGSGPGGNHAWKDIELTSNVRNYYTVFAQHDSRALFAPTYPETRFSTTVTVEIMPGAHSTIAMETGDLKEAGTIVYDLAKRFLQLHGTAFSSRTLLSASDLINLYAKVQMEFQKYRAKAKPDPNWLKRKFGVSSDRTIKDDTGHAVGRMLIDRVGYFVNEHHRDLFQAKYFYLTQEIDKPASEAFRSGNVNSGWAREASQLSGNEPAAFEQLGIYVDLVFRA